MNTINEKRLFQIILLAGVLLIGFAIFLFLFWQTKTLWSPCITGLFVAYLFFPLVTWGELIGIPRGVVTAVIVLLILGMLITLSSLLFPLVIDEIRGLRKVPMSSVPDVEKPGIYYIPTKETNESTLLNVIYQTSLFLYQQGLIEEVWDPQKVRTVVNQWLSVKGEEFIGVISLKAMRMGQFTMIFFFVLIFGLLEGDKFYRSLINMLPNSLFEPGIFVLHNTSKMFGNYLRGVVIETAILGIICLLCLLPLLFFFQNLSLFVIIFMMLIIAFTNVIRIIGPILGAIITAFMVFSATNNFHAVLFLLLVVCVIQILDNFLILPLVMEDQVSIHPVFCLLGVLSGGILGGILGMILAIPVLGGIKILWQVILVELRRFHVEYEENKVYTYKF